MGYILLTDCCGVNARNWGGAGGSVWGHVDTCRKCDKENPVMVQVDTSEHFKCCWAPKYLGHFFGCPNSPENK